MVRRIYIYKLFKLIHNIVIVLQSQAFQVNNITASAITVINTSSIEGIMGPEITLSLPLELLEQFTDASGSVRIVSSVYRNISSFFLNDK